MPAPIHFDNSNEKSFVPLPLAPPVQNALQLPGDETVNRLLKRKAVLELLKIPDLGALGKLTWSPGMRVAPQAGLTIPHASMMNAPEALFEQAFRYIRTALGNILVPDSGKVKYLKPAAAAPDLIPVDQAFWAATWIDIPANTTILLKDGIKKLTFLCEKLTVGENVTFSWERPSRRPPARPGKPAKPPTPPPSSTLTSGPEAPAGGVGVNGNRGFDGLSALLVLFELKPDDEESRSEGREQVGRYLAALNEAVEPDKKLTGGTGFEGSLFLEFENGGALWRLSWRTPEPGVTLYRWSYRRKKANASWKERAAQQEEELPREEVEQRGELAEQAIRAAYEGGERPQSFQGQVYLPVDCR